MVPTTEPSSDPADEAIQQFLSGVEAAVQEIHELFLKPLLRFLLSLGAGDHAEGLIEDVIYAAWNGRTKYRGQPRRKPFFAWLKAIARNLYYSLRRKTDKIPAHIELGDVEIPADPQAEARDLVRYLFERLAKKDGLLLQMRYLDGADDDTIARELRLARGTVRNRMRQALVRAYAIGKPEFGN